MMTQAAKTQADRIIAKFGGARGLARALQALGDTHQLRSPAVIYRWTYPKTRGGTGGKIPSSALDAVIRAARLEGILITADDLYGDLK
ncbi:hypothetical protein [Nitrosovibrio sp. Nv4]|uniref:hypothetical protein n=1 Tax=Nitrosovibrio sp. Nv4 TaxID=1945880 RepID=UPI000BCC8E59|nr:hypothetical protein [Nitrosovibrio sp. Nv4]SOD41341.1 hypothetical protein SAMN06298226_1636 [Nitrosovibrio sp. Nv4]